MRPNWKSKGRRIQDAKRRLNEVRTWSLKCRECEHVGDVTTTLRRLRAAKLVCSACGAPVVKRSERIAAWRAQQETAISP